MFVVLFLLGGILLTAITFYTTLDSRTKVMLSTQDVMPLPALSEPMNIRETPRNLMEQMTGFLLQVKCTKSVLYLS